MKVRGLGVGKERVWPPDLVQHLITNAQFVLAGVVEVEPCVVPVLTKVEVQREVLLSTRQQDYTLGQQHSFEYINRY